MADGLAEVEGSSLHILSWNVAGLDATLKYINSHYKSLDAFLGRHRCDILCLQETKLQRSKILADPAGTCAHPFGAWESFWAIPTTEGSSSSKVAKRGFNGVTTFARKGLTLAANAAPLGDPSLDGEGRVLLTDHGGFVLLNVYAHATGEGDDYQQKLQRKLTFLAALRAKMAELRAAGRKVVLCGDLNIANRGADVPWKQALLPVATLDVAHGLPGTRTEGGQSDSAAAADGRASAGQAVEVQPSAPAGGLVEGGKAAAAQEAAGAAANLHLALGGAVVVSVGWTVGIPHPSLMLGALAHKKTAEMDVS